MSAGDPNSGFHACTERVFQQISCIIILNVEFENGKKNFREGTFDYTAWLSFVY